jgi:hypothetical protein
LEAKADRLAVERELRAIRGERARKAAAVIREARAQKAVCWIRLVNAFDTWS